MKQGLFLALLFLTHFSFSQLLTGTITDSDSLIKIGFASIGVLHQNKGTVADGTGHFSLDITRFSDKDTLRISAIGYEEIRFLIKHCREFLVPKEMLVLELSPLIQAVDEVHVTSGKSKIVTAGNNIKSPLIVAGFQNRALGSELGTVLKYSKKKKGRIMSFNFNVSGIQTDSILFRVNLYSMKNGFPAENLLKKPIYAYNLVHNGTISIDLSEENLHIKEDCFLSIELIKDLDFEGLFFKSAFLKSPSFHRPTAQAEWQKATVDVGIWAEIWYKK